MVVLIFKFQTPYSQDPVGTSVTFSSIAVTLYSVAVTDAELWSRTIFPHCRSFFRLSENLSCQTLVISPQQWHKVCKSLAEWEGVTFPAPVFPFSHTPIFPKHNVQCQTTVNSYIVATQFKDAQEGQLCCILHNVRPWKEWKGKSREKAVATKWPTLSMFLACLEVFGCTGAPWKGSLWSLSEKWCKTIAEIDCVFAQNKLSRGMCRPFFAHPCKLFLRGLALLTVSRGKQIQGKARKCFLLCLTFLLGCVLPSRVEQM